MGTYQLETIQTGVLLHSKAIHNEALAYDHGGQLGLGGISGF